MVDITQAMIDAALALRHTPEDIAIATSYNGDSAIEVASYEERQLLNQYRQHPHFRLGASSDPSPAVHRTNTLSFNSSGFQQHSYITYYHQNDDIWDEGVNIKCFIPSNVTKKLNPTSPWDVFNIRPISCGSCSGGCNSNGCSVQIFCIEYTADLNQGATNFTLYHTSYSTLILPYRDSTFLQPNWFILPTGGRPYGRHSQKLLVFLVGAVTVPKPAVQTMTPVVMCGRLQVHICAPGNSHSVDLGYLCSPGVN